MIDPSSTAGLTMPFPLVTGPILELRTKPMLRIVHVGGFSLKPKGTFLNSAAWKISNGLIRNGHSVINFSDRDTARANSLLGHRKFGIGAANKILRQLCREAHPEFLLLSHADVIRPETVADIRADLPGLRVLQWNIDPVFESDNIRRISSKLEVVDATLVSTAGKALLPLVRPGKLLGFLPNAVDFSIERGRAYEHADLPFDLFNAVGGPQLPRNICGTDWKPDDLIDRIEAEIPGIRLKLGAMRGLPGFAGARLDEALSTTAMGLNLSRRNDNYLYSSDRISHMAGNGMAVLVDRATGYGDLFSEDEFVFFSTIEEMIAQIRRLIGDPTTRQKIAEAGHARYHDLFNEQIIARYIVDVAFGSLKESDYPWPTLVSAES